MISTWTSTEMDILETLALKLRVLTSQQILSGWVGSSDNKLAEDLMLPLCEAGLVKRQQVYAHPILSVGPPAFSWNPGDPPPTYSKLEELADHFQKRWNQSDVLFDVYFATKQAGNLFGAHLHTPPAINQWTHDIHVAEIYLYIKANGTINQLQSVIGEAALPKLGLQIKHFKDPDLFIVDPFQQANMVIEFAGAYDAQHLYELHEHCAGGAYQELIKRFPDRQHRLYPSADGTSYALV